MKQPLLAVNHHNGSYDQIFVDQSKETESDC